MVSARAFLGVIVATGFCRPTVRDDATSVLFETPNTEYWNGIVGPCLEKMYFWSFTVRLNLSEIMMTIPHLLGFWVLVCQR